MDAGVVVPGRVTADVVTRFFQSSLTVLSGVIMGHKFKPSAPEGGIAVDDKGKPIAAKPMAALGGFVPSKFTDNTTGTSSDTMAAGVGIETLVIPCTLPAGTGAADQITAYTPGYKFKILAWSYTTAVAGVGASASRVFNMEIGTTDVGSTPSTITLTEASTSDVGEQTAGTAVSGANTGSASDTISIEVAAGGTAFTAGSGFFTIKFQNMDTADAFAALAAKIGKILDLLR